MSYKIMLKRIEYVLLKITGHLNSYISLNTPSIIMDKFNVLVLKIVNKKVILQY